MRPQVYFRLNTLRLCKNLINAVHSRQFAPFDAFPASQRVTYKYYTGRLAIFDEQYVRLLSCLPATCCLSHKWACFEGCQIGERQGFDSSCPARVSRCRGG